jgi:glycosyltransferase involved in cell wall biosynthesis
MDLLLVINSGACAPFIGPCLASLRSQTFEDWRAVVTVDDQGDRTYESAIDAAGTDFRIELVRNVVPRFALANLVAAVNRARPGPDDVIVVLDGDDRLNLPDALSIVVATYERTGCWMTYGSWVSDQPERAPGLWPAYPEGTDDFRAAPWRATHLRTWKQWLWDLVRDRDLRDDDGHYFRSAVDLAVMIPMLEMSGTPRARHIAEPLCYLNRGYFWRTSDARYQEQQHNDRLIRSRPPYPRLGGRPRTVSFSGGDPHPDPLPGGEGTNLPPSPPGRGPG